MAIHQGPTGKEAKAMSYAHGIGGTRAGVMETTFAEETETISSASRPSSAEAQPLVKVGFETLVERFSRNLPGPSACTAETHCRPLLPRAAATCAIPSTTPRIRGLNARPLITRDQEGDEKDTQRDTKRPVAQEWILENQAGRPVFNALEKKDRGHLIEKVGKELRKMMMD